MPDNEFSFRHSWERSQTGIIDQKSGASISTEDLTACRLVNVVHFCFLSTHHASESAPSAIAAMDHKAGTGRVPEAAGESPVPALSVPAPGLSGEGGGWLSLWEMGGD